MLNNQIRIMKKLYFFIITVFVTTLSFGQASNLYFSMYGEGSSNNKWLEIYNGTGSDVDLGNYSVELYSNGAASATNTLTFTGGTMLTNGDVYVIYNASANAAIIANGDISSSVTFFNGDDAIALLEMGSVIDVIGQIGFDPGTAWNVGSTTGGTVNHTLVRKSDICDPNPIGADSFGSDDATSEWTVYASDAEWGQIGSHVGCSSAPTLFLTGLPASGSTIVVGPEDLAGDLEFGTLNFTVGEPGTVTEGDGYIGWIIYNVTDGNVIHDSGNIYDLSSPTPFIPLLPNKQYQLTSVLFDNSDQELVNPEAFYFLTANTLGYNAVADIAALRAHVDANGEGLYYEITGASLVTHTDGFQNRKWIQDGNISGILIYDTDGIIMTSYLVGDHVTGIKGQTSIVNGVLRLNPTTDSGLIESSGNPVVPQIVTIASLNSAPDDYESELVELQNVSFVAGDGVATFATGTNYDVTDGVNTIIKRTDFFGADYIGQLIPSGFLPSIVAVAGEFNGTAQIYVRNMDDITLSNDNFDFASFSLFPNPTSNGIVNIVSTNNSPMEVRVFNILGKQVRTETITSTLNVSGLKSGIYILNITQEGHSVTKKLVIE